MKILVMIAIVSMILSFSIIYIHIQNQNKVVVNENELFKARTELQEHIPIKKVEEVKAFFPNLN